MTPEEELMNRISCSLERAYAISLWNEFYDEVRHKNRFFPHSAFAEKYIHPLASEKYRSTMHQEAAPLYRARLISPEDYRHMKFDEQLCGFDCGHSGAPSAALQSLNEYLITSGVQTDTVLSKRDYLKVQTAYANPSTVSREQVEAFRQ